MSDNRIKGRKEKILDATLGLMGMELVPVEGVPDKFKGYENPIVSIEIKSKKKAKTKYKVMQYKCPECDESLNIIDVNQSCIEFCPHCGVGRDLMNEPMYKSESEISIPELPEY